MTGGGNEGDDGDCLASRSLLERCAIAEQVRNGYEQSALVLYSKKAVKESLCSVSWLLYHHGYDHPHGLPLCGTTHDDHAHGVSHCGTTHDDHALFLPHCEPCMAPVHGAHFHG
ncbi:hypothetical transcript [Echinococcus multilocularis]|uniref:Hypothetical transcript n=1 Tax=Echinococcus multilocularis TaxID=6211 RepID=A0A068XUU8_ECHMU|nr:hypothetical transcript [Echinococcus multilocularis]